jgi:hypothetical protein
VNACHTEEEIGKAVGMTQQAIGKVLQPNAGLRRAETGSRRCPRIDERDHGHTILPLETGGLDRQPLSS